MSKFFSVLEVLKKALADADYTHEAQLLEYTYRIVQQIYAEKKELDAQDKKNLLEFIFDALPRLGNRISNMSDPREKDDATLCMEIMLHIVTIS